MPFNEDNQRSARRKLSPSFFLGFLPLLLIISLEISFRLFPPSLIVYEPRFLLPILNSFLFLASCVIAYLALMGFLAKGGGTLLWLGCGVLTLGMAALLAGWLMAPFGPNVNVTIFNMGALLAAVCHMIGIMTKLHERPGELSTNQRRVKAALACLGVLAAVALVAVLAIKGVMPPFFIQGQGPTPLRQQVVEWTIVLYLSSSLFLMERFLRTRLPFLYWYSLALGLLAVSMIGIYLQPAVGSLLGWTGRSAQYLAALYFLAAAYSVLRAAKTQGVALNEVIAELFGSEIQWQTILVMMHDAVISVADQGKVLLWNKAAERLFGYPQAEIIGKDLGLILPELKALSAQDGETDTKIKRRDGSYFNAEVSSMKKTLSLGLITTLIIRDITERKQAEREREMLIKQLQKALEEVKTLKGFLPICANCKKIRNDGGYWQQIESYIKEHSEAEFSHGICPECLKELYPDFSD